MTRDSDIRQSGLARVIWQERAQRRASRPGAATTVADPMLGQDRLGALGLTANLTGRRMGRGRDRRPCLLL